MPPQPSLDTVQRLLEETKALVKDNHSMLRAMRRDAWIGFGIKALFWLLVIVAPIYFLLPYLEYLPTPEQYQEVMKLYQGQLPVQ